MGTRSTGGGRGGLKGTEGPNAHGSTLDKISARLTKLGVRSNIAPNVDLSDPQIRARTEASLRMFAEQAEAFRAANPDAHLPELIVVLDQRGVGLYGMDWTTVPAAAETLQTGATTMFANVGHIGGQTGLDYWDDPQAFMAALQREDEYSGRPSWSTYEPSQLWLHELVHQDTEKGYVAAGLPDKIFGGLGYDTLLQQAGKGSWWDRETNEVEPHIQQIGMYATTTPEEFVAEVGAGLLLGRAYPDSIMGLYDDLHGRRYGMVAAA